MKVILVGVSLDNRLTKETHIKPKPHVKMGEKPILSHIMKI